MRGIVVQEFITLDGLVAGPNNSVDFIPQSMQGDRKFGREQLALMETTDTLLLGRATYDMFAGYWPNASKEGDEQEFADKFNALQKVVFSKTLERAPWGEWGEARIARSTPVDEAKRLKQQSGKDILVSGSISIAQTLIDQHLIDEYRLVFCPMVLGSGRRLFRDEGEPMKMNLVRANGLDRGGVSLIYSE
jgi:dihydrofolate reductase